jgi:multidrug efflux pump subunit AcrA (membrane-fusion protein)
VATEIIATGEVVPPDDGVARVGAKLSGRITRLTKGVGDPGDPRASAGHHRLARSRSGQGRLHRRGQRGQGHARDRRPREGAVRSQDRRRARLAAGRGRGDRARAEKEAAELRLHTLGCPTPSSPTCAPISTTRRRSAVASPLAGVVVERPVALGQMVEPQDTMFVVMDLRTVWVQVDVYERNLNQIAVGAEGRGLGRAWPERTLRRHHPVDRRGARSAVAHDQGAGRARQQRRRAQARHVRQGHPGRQHRRAARGHLRPGGGGPARRRGVDRVRPGRRPGFQLRELELGGRSGDWIEVTRGLTVGERVVTTGSFLLKSEARRESFGGHEH